MSVRVTVEVDNALTFQADVLALKYAQSTYGVDALAVHLLSKEQDDILGRLPKIGGNLLVESNGALGAEQVLFLGVKPLYDFKYREIREFAKEVITTLESVAPQTIHLALTLHGAGYGLDETEAFESEIAGLAEAISDSHFPKGLQQITIVERDLRRSERLKAILSRLLPFGIIGSDERNSLSFGESASTERLRDVGYDSVSKPYVFVAMPFDESMEDVFHFGIQGAVNNAGFLCERADLSSFTGDVMEWVKNRIENSSLVIADLTAANPNVYLEVGFAWGRNKPTILLIHNSDELKFDVKGQRCLKYRNIRDLEEILHSELKNLSSVIR